MKSRTLSLALAGSVLVCSAVVRPSNSRADPVAEKTKLASLDTPRYTEEEAAIEDRVPPEESGDREELPPKEKPKHSIAHKVLLYIPNRILDVFDIFRVRVRVGPGVAVGARVTKYVQAYLGAYGAVYAGLPGARQRPMPRSPIGLETNNGLTVSVLDATIDGGFGPDYSPTEIGAGAQLAVIGFDLGIDPWEIVDFAAGILTLDVRDDDL